MASINRRGNYGMFVRYCNDAGTLLGCDRPSERDLNNHVIPEAANQWRKIGVELLDDDSVKQLDIIESDCKNVCYNQANL